MKRLLLVGTCLLPVAVLGQTAFPYSNRQGNGPAQAGDPPKLGERRAADQAKQDFGGDVSNQHVTADGATRQRLLPNKLAEILTPADFLDSAHDELLLRTGQMDAVPALIAWQAKGGGLLPCGTYRIDTPWVWPAAASPLVQARPGCVTVQVNFATGDALQLNNPQNGSVEGFTLATLVPHTSGQAIHQAQGAQNQYHKITITGRWSGDAFQFDGSNTVYADELSCKTPLASGVFTVGQFAAGACVHLLDNAVEVHVTHSVSNNWQFGLQLTSTQGATFAYNDWIASGNALKIDPSSAHGDTVWGVTSDHDYFDTSYADNVLFGGTGQVSDVQMTAPWSSFSQTGNGFAFSNPNLDGIQVASADVLDNYAAAVAALAGTNIQFAAPQMFMNSQKGAGASPDVSIGAAVGSFTLLGGFCGLGGHVHLDRPALANNTSTCVAQAAGATAPQFLKVIGLHGISHTSANLLSLQPTTGNYAGTVNLGNTGN